MKHLFVPYETALKLKEKGFDERCFGHYVEPCLIHLLNDEALFVETAILKPKNFVIINAPLYQQVIDWFREKHNLHFEIKVEDYVSEPSYYWSIFGKYKDMLHIRCLMNSGDKFTQDRFKSYYEALIKAIEEALKLI